MRPLTPAEVLKFERVQKRLARATDATDSTQSALFGEPTTLLLNAQYKRVVFHIQAAVHSLLMGEKALNELQRQSIPPKPKRKKT